ncbi:MAG: hypothetical protein KGL35_03435 [Bradyrhizobium sp.]|uniref:hypothetical protein n=1 Tax=Bradyrhizobium sp. TaxID=376 RepID=UPI001C28C744|nr:hypothetical protein [Bradyrhizobium sp.]MBU6461383.1 hypothetical protein [Pseudomonadota bacterium]MDE2066561.1 hypothetical protein [Bradyrhizobium sp.]MDE2467800.1 hypothetical protein [Bradyrhizobium sp.]
MKEQDEIVAGKIIEITASDDQCRWSYPLDGKAAAIFDVPSGPKHRFTEFVYFATIRG